MEKEAIQWVGICISGTLGAASLGWQIFKELTDRRAKARQLAVDRAELVEIRGLDFGTDHQTGSHGVIRLRNCGIRPVYLEAVVFGYGITRNGDELTRWDEIDFDSTRPLSEPLQPGEGREFRLKLWRKPELDNALNRRDCWVSIKSHDGEIGRIAFERMASSIQSLSEASKREPSHNPKSARSCVITDSPKPPAVL